MDAMTLEMGELALPALLFGGPCSNLRALEAMLAEAGRLFIPPERMICTGDLAAYCAEPAETVARIRDLGCPVIAGNCERQFGARAEACGCGFAEGSACDALSGRWFAYADARLDDGARDWMAGLPARAIFTLAGRRYAVIHGGETAINRFLWPTSPEAELRQEIAALEAILGRIDGVVCGHSGLPFHRRVDGRDWINAGAIGMPPNDGDPRAACAVLREEGVEFRRLDYDFEAAAAAMERAGLSQGYHDALRTGWWPSEEVLPPSMRRAAAS